MGKFQRLRRKNRQSSARKNPSQLPQAPVKQGDGAIALPDFHDSSTYDSGQILELQRTIGNQAVMRMLGMNTPPAQNRLKNHAMQATLMREDMENDHSHSPQIASNTATDVPMIRRFVSSEHRSLGDLNADETPVDFPEGTLFPNSPELSYGEIVALAGDFYGTFENLANPNYINAEGAVVPNSEARKISEVNQLKRLFQVEAEVRADGHEPHGLDIGNIEHDGESLEGFDKVTGGRYLALAEQNFPHFTDATPNNISTWMSGHAQALAEAYEAGIVNDESQKLMAMARNAASNHYLTDAFASGHMRVPRTDIDTYYRNMMAQVAPGMKDALLDHLPNDLDFTINLRRFVPDFVLDNVPGIERYLTKRINIEIRSKVAEKIEPYVADFTALMRDEVGPKLGGLVSKWLHDADNENGLLVSNAAGGQWVAYGDSFVDREAPAGVSTNTTNRAEAQKAVAADRAEVEAMFEAGRANAEGETTTTAGIIPDAVYFDFDQPKLEGDASVLNPSNRTQLDGLAQYVNSVEGVTINLDGWADSRGSDGYNQGLATRRISAVQAYLMGAGVPSEKIGAPSPHGEPLIPTTSGNHHMFRRVDIRLEGTPVPIEDDKGTEAPIPEPFAAEQFLPQVDASNTPMEPYEWCNLDQAQKDSLRNGMKPIITGGAKDMLQAAVEDALPNDFDIDFTIPVPYFDDVHIHETISIQDMVMDKAKPLIDGALKGVMSDAVFGNLMDGACNLAD